MFLSTIPKLFGVHRLIRTRQFIIRLTAAPSFRSAAALRWARSGEVADGEAGDGTADGATATSTSTATGSATTISITSTISGMAIAGSTTLLIAEMYLTPIALWRTDSGAGTSLNVRTPA